MARADVLHPDGSDFHQFLYAFVGADRDGFMVTVLSTLARLGLDPWKEASELADPSKEAAEDRLGVLLAGFRDVPALTGEKESIARTLIALLPTGATRPVRLQAGSSPKNARIGSVVSILAMALVLMLLVQLLVPGAAGLGS